MVWVLPTQTRPYCWWFRNPANQPELGNLDYLQSLHIPGGDCRISSLNNIEIGNPSKNDHRFVYIVKIPPKTGKIMKNSWSPIEIMQFFTFSTSFTNFTPLVRPPPDPPATVRSGRFFGSPVTPVVTVSSRPWDRHPGLGRMQSFQPSAWYCGIPMMSTGWAGGGGRGWSRGRSSVFLIVWSWGRASFPEHPFLIRIN